MINLNRTCQIYWNWNCLKTTTIYNINWYII